MSNNIKISILFCSQKLHLHVGIIIINAAGPINKQHFLSFPFIPRYPSLSYRPHHFFPERFTRKSHQGPDKKK